MRKSELINRIAAQQQTLSHSDIEYCVDQIITCLTDSLSRKGRIEIRDFGNLHLHYQEKRIAHNPRTNQKVEIPAKYKVRFKLGKLLKERLNSQ